MPVSASYREWVLEQLEPVAPVTARAMFGGIGLSSGGLFFALIADDVLYFKVDDSNRADYEAAGMGPFQPFGEDSYAMSYYEVPAAVLEDEDALRLWMGKALAVAQTKKRKAKK